MIGKAFWIANGLLCAVCIEVFLVPHSENPLIFHLAAGLVVLGGIAKASGFKPPF